ncbi:hypothetical protein BDN70DRAFT_929471 [Pholiota conissans]|uniref:F-box domain-containing protein n=1 Tax=Pholiota conissans TaxID=109636 RepID=A0A9P6CWP3_9AGAR|nr:hypothetical protein BDN70DRAFT_929471 [Pholiota conissans]
MHIFRALNTKRHATLLSVPGSESPKLRKFPQPPVPHLLNTNERPSESESLLVFDAIEEAERRIFDLRERLSVIPNTDSSGLDARNRTEVKAQLKNTMEFVRQHQGIVSVVRRGIPPEILQEIFSYLLPMFWLDPPKKDFTSNYNKAVKDLWVMTRVCRLWRESAMCMPSFCGQLPPVRVTVKESKVRTKRWMRIFTEFLHRSAGVPLSVFIFIEDLDGSERLRNPILDIVLGASKRWRHVVIVSEMKALKFYFQSLKGKIPMLQSLTMVTIGRLRPMREVQVPDMFTEAPALKQVCFRGHTSLFPKLDLPQSQLTHFNDDCIFRRGDLLFMATDKRRVFKLPSSLETLVIGIERLTFAQVESELLHPRELYIKMPYIRVGQTPPKIHKWISALTMKKLYIDIRDGISIVTTQYSVAWILNILPTHSSKSLTHLGLRILFIDDNSQFRLSYLLDYTPALVRLDISLPSANDILRLSSRSQLGEFSVPILQICNFYAEDGFISRRTRDAINTLARLRCECWRPLHELAIYCAWTRITSYVVKGQVPTYTFEGSLRRKELNLEHWYITSEFDQLERFKQRLCDAVPELVGQPPPTRSKLFSFGQLSEKVHKILDDIDVHTIARIENLYASDLHLVLKKISDEQVPRDEKYHFSDHAQRILEKWRPLFEANLKNRRWMVRGKSSLVYIAYDDPLRGSPEYFDSMVYGSKPRIPTGPIVEIWPEILNN